MPCFSSLLSYVISFIGWLTAILQVDQGHDDARPYPLAIWLALSLAYEFEDMIAQGYEIRP